MTNIWEFNGGSYPVVVVGSGMNMDYSLVIVEFVIVCERKMATEIVSFPMKEMVDLFILFCKRLPEGSGSFLGNFGGTFWGI